MKRTIRMVPFVKYLASLSAACSSMLLDPTSLINAYIKYLKSKYASCIIMYSNITQPVRWQSVVKMDKSSIDRAMPLMISKVAAKGLHPAPYRGFLHFFHPKSLAVEAIFVAQCSLALLPA